MRITQLTVSVSLLVALATSVALAEGPYASQGPRKDHRLHSNEPWIDVDVRITPTERDVIQTYIQSLGRPGKSGKKLKALPPGLAKKKARGDRLPPGWQKKCLKGEVLPLEVYRQCHPLPREVIAALPPPPPGTILVAISGKIVRLVNATREILDVFDVKL